MKVILVATLEVILDFLNPHRLNIINVYQGRLILFTIRIMDPHAINPLKFPLMLTRKGNRILTMEEGKEMLSMKLWNSVANYKIFRSNNLLNFKIAFVYKLSMRLFVTNVLLNLNVGNTDYPNNIQKTFTICCLLDLTHY